MKKLAKNVPLCTAILVVVAILAIPLLGGLKLSNAYRSAEKQFENRLTTPFEENNKDIFNSSEEVIVAAQTLLDKGRQLTSSTAVEAKAKLLGEAIDACSAAKGGIDRYLACEKLASAAELYHKAFNSEEQQSLDREKTNVEAKYSTVKNSYRTAYAAYSQQTADLVSGFPAAQLAGLFGIGGAK